MIISVRQKYKIYLNHFQPFINVVKLLMTIGKKRYLLKTLFTNVFERFPLY